MSKSCLEVANFLLNSLWFKILDPVFTQTRAELSVVTKGNDIYSSLTMSPLVIKMDLHWILEMVTSGLHVTLLQWEP